MERVPSSPAIAIPAAAAAERIYSCAQVGCGQRYTSPAGLLEHCVDVHNLVVSQSPMADAIAKGRGTNTIQI
jgi:hypothetical protein